MAYGNIYPSYYSQNYGQAPQMMMPQQNNIQAQNLDFVPVPNEDVARNYPVAPGKSVTFKDENAPYIYTKTMGFSQLDRPLFEKYRLIKEDDQPTTNSSNKDINWKSEADKIWSEINVLKREIAKTTDLAKREDEYGA